MLPIYSDVHHCMLPYINLYTSGYKTQQLPKLAVTDWSCSVVASKMVYTAVCEIGANVFVGAHLSFQNHQFIYSGLRVDGVSAY